MVVGLNSPSPGGLTTEVANAGITRSYFHLIRKRLGLGSTMVFSPVEARVFRLNVLGSSYASVSLWAGLMSILMGPGRDYNADATPQLTRIFLFKWTYNCKNWDAGISEIVQKAFRNQPLCRLLVCRNCCNSD
jgi:hypothetical protein